MHRSKRKRNIIIFSLVGVLLCMVVGYAAFNTKLEIKGTSKVTSNWDIRITNVTDGTPIGGAENTVAPNWDNLTASMEANLYDKGDAMEYDVTIENKGTLDAKLNDILTNLENENNEAVLITFSGYTKGEVLKAGGSKLVHVKIEYNPEYEGGETSSEVEINFDYGQNNNEENNPDEQYLLTYDYTTNGGQSVDLNQEYILSGSDVNLNNKATKEGWTFIGWNTDKDSNIGLKEYQMPKENTTLYAIYSKDLKVTYEKGENIESIGKVEDKCTIYNNETSCEITLPSITPVKDYIIDGWYSGSTRVGSAGVKYTVSDNTTLTAKSKADNIILGISTTNTTNSITVVASASATSGISKYEFSKDGGKTWVNGGTNKAYTFSGLTQGTSYNIQIRVTANSGKTSTTSKTVKTSSLTKPTFKEAATSTGKTVTITYPSGCGSTYTCTYQKDNGTAVTVKSTTASVAFTANGSVVAKVTDGTNSVSSSYNVTRIVAISVGSVRGGSSSLPKSKAVNGETITFTASPSSDFTYQGATVVCNNGVKYNVSNSSKSFSISNTACTSAVLYPTWKKNQKVVMNGATRDSTFSLTKYDTNATKPHFNSYSTFYAFESKNPNDIQDNYTIVSTRGQMTSSKKYNISDYSKLSIMISGSYFSGSGGRVVYFGLIRSNSTWVNTAASPDVRAEVSLPSSNFANTWYDLNLNQKSNSNTYYVVVQYLSINNVSTLNVSSIIFEGQTYSYTNRGV